jgi:ABC-type lipoprotein release transport system permease subunit
MHEVIIKNLFRRKIRTLLTILGIAIGVAAIVSLGAMADGLDSGYSAMLQGSKADLVLSQPNAMDISYSSVDEELGEQLLAAPEVKEVSPMLQGFTVAESEPFFFIFGYEVNSFIMERFNLIEGHGLDSREATTSHGKPILLGSAAAEILNKSVGDSLRITGSVYRIIGIYQTGDAFEDAGAVLSLKDAQELLGKPRQVSLYYIRLKELGLTNRFLTRVERLWPDLSISSTEEYADKQSMSDMLNATVWSIGGLAIVIGGIGMLNAQLMSIMERTREIGVLRAVGWSSRRILWMILMESVIVCLLGGFIGLAGGYSLIVWISRFTVIVGINPGNITGALIAQALMVVFILGLVGGLYPAWRASKLQPVEALRYEGGSSGSRIHRLPIGGMAVQSLWQRSTRTLLTLGVIGVTVGAIMAIEGVMKGMTSQMTNMFLDSDAEIMLRQADIADTSLSAIDDRDAAKIAAMPEVESVSGVVFTGIMMPEAGGFFILFGYEPKNFAIQRYRIVEGEPLVSNHQIILGRTMAEALNKKPGNTIELSGYRYRIVGIFETGIGWEELGGVITLRDGQTFTGRPRKSTMYALKLKDPRSAVDVVDKINRNFPSIHAAITSDFTNQLPDMKNSESMISSISYLAIIIGGVAVLNTMMMSVFERTREIGVLRALGWQRRRILGLIMREAAILGFLGGAVGIGLAVGFVVMLRFIPTMGMMFEPVWELPIILRAITAAFLLGIIGGLYPAFRATRLQPIEALRYE